MPIGKDDGRPTPSLVTSREPQGPRTADKSVGTQGLTDALIIVGIAWAVLFVLVFSLRVHNV